MLPWEQNIRGRLNAWNMVLNRWLLLPLTVSPLSPVFHRKGAILRCQECLQEIFSKITWTCGCFLCLNLSFEIGFVRDPRWSELLSWRGDQSGEGYPHSLTLVCRKLWLLTFLAFSTDFLWPYQRPGAKSGTANTEVMTNSCPQSIEEHVIIDRWVHVWKMQQ